MSEKSAHVKVQKNLEPLIDFFFDNRRELLNAAEEHCRSDNLQELQSIGHNFKGACGGYGFHELSQLGSELQEAENMDRARELVRQMREHLESVEIVYV